MQSVYRRLLAPAASAFLIFTALHSTASLAEIQFSQLQEQTTVDIIDKLGSRHYRNLPFDDKLSEQMLDNYLKALDPARVFFLQSDVDQFRKRYGDKLDDQLKSGNLDAGEEIFNTFENRARERLQWIISKLETDAGFKFDFTQDEFLSIDEDNIHWPKTAKEADEQWRKRVKAGMLSLVLSDQTQEKARETLLRRYRNQLARLDKRGADDVYETLINSLAILYDPHTSYLAPRTEENFNISMSLSLEGIGAVLQTEDEMTKVVRLVSGGPAEKQGDLKPADRIIGVGQGKDGEMVDVVGWRLDEVVDLIRGPKGTVVRLKVLPVEAADESNNKIVLISRDKVKLEEQAAKKGIIELTDGQDLFKIGVIHVPAFYIDFEAYRRGDRNFKSTTGDVYRLLTELRQENIDGLIIDLRNNGGGSLQEATTLTDLFIDQGPVVQIRQTAQSISRNYRSRQPAVYRGPMVVLTNRLSASASEIFAGAIQDYKRGLIVGSQSFGKGTVQSLMPVESGQLKLTESKFYRVSGDSTQHRGVIPDVAFPQLVDIDEVGESSYETALPWDQIHPVPHDSYYPLNKVLPQVVARHQSRSEKDPDFIFIQQQLEQLRSNKSRTQLSLNEATRRAEQKALEDKALELENQRRKVKGLPLFESANALEEDQEKRADERMAEAGDKDLHTEDDPLLAEAGYVLIDMIGALQKQPPDQVADF
ncbi:carboxy terminal-processing peptidase [Pseudomaricurvus sp. HS19]|uniref:carboxy terminal-processing peptidase n=1 Tax=Pseudomaricurvus sp. HS19 TaxID=2692626 RepID=UPI0013704A7E|nr:carboxy terminal-processing peptidase [Pseudomaricurvus sp. HS19]MYM62442.1 tail-specific protease [Pseudomaricurvus sp. HS19]